MTDQSNNLSGMPDDMAEFLQTFLDETEEQLDDLVETMLALERDPSSAADINESFRLIHTIKGSAGMMGFDKITVLTHHLESHFERLRSGLVSLDDPTMNLVLRCVDFLRDCNNRLRDGESLGSPSDLLDELAQLSVVAAPVVAAPVVTAPVVTDEPPHAAVELLADEPPAAPVSPIVADGQAEPQIGDTLIRMVVKFRADLELADLKAQLIVSRLAHLAEIRATIPDLGQPTHDKLEAFEILMEAFDDLAQLRNAANVDGVTSIEFTAPEPTSSAGASAPPIAGNDNEVATPTHVVTSGLDDGPVSTNASTPSILAGNDAAAPPSAEAPPAAESTEPAAVTMRVDIDRLDQLMNLTGELVVNRARFAQLSGQISPALRNPNMLNRIRDFSDRLRHTIHEIENLDDVNGVWSAQIQHLRAGLDLMQEQCDVWNGGRQSFSQISEAIDQLSRVSNKLQRGVLETRMVPVGPLFNRFQRVVRDLAKGRGKQVNLLIRGEKTELDKRMIDELGDPLIHLIRNSIDHGLETPELRVSSGKPEAGTVILEASHSGNNVYICVRDDGVGIDVNKIKSRLVTKQILTKPAAEQLSEEQAFEYIWDPGFSTAAQVTSVSGRGVGMDAVKTRINQLNGTIDVDSKPRQGTTFTIRLPLTLAIINSLLVRLNNVVFSMPIADVREIVSVAENEIVTVQQRQTFDVRGEFILLLRLDDIFQWQAVDDGYDRSARQPTLDSDSDLVDVVILQSAGQTIGLRVDELLGSQDVVIKSLADNFVHVRGLSGASIMGDGSVSLMLDVGTLIEMATRSARTRDPQETQA